MTAKTDRKIEAAKRAADILDRLSYHLEANFVRSVCSANMSLALTCSQLHKENMDFRQSKESCDGTGKGCQNG